MSCSIAFLQHDGLHKQDVLAYRFNSNLPLRVRNLIAKFRAKDANEKDLENKVNRELIECIGVWHMSIEPDEYDTW